MGCTHRFGVSSPSYRPPSFSPAYSFLLSASLLTREVTPPRHIWGNLRALLRRGPGAPSTAAPSVLLNPCAVGTPVESRKIFAYGKWGWPSKRHLPAATFCQPRHGLGGTWGNNPRQREVQYTARSPFRGPGEIPLFWVGPVTYSDSSSQGGGCRWRRGSIIRPSLPSLLLVSSAYVLAPKERRPGAPSTAALPVLLNPCFVGDSGAVRIFLRLQELGLAKERPPGTSCPLPRMLWLAQDQGNKARRREDKYTAPAPWCIGPGEFWSFWVGPVRL